MGGCPTLEQANAGVKDVGKCNELIKDSLSFKMVCDATSFRSEYFKDAKCETTQPDVPEPHKSIGAASETKWGVCKKDGAGGSMMVSGAQALTPLSPLVPPCLLPSTDRRCTTFENLELKT